MDWNSAPPTKTVKEVAAPMKIEIEFDLTVTDLSFFECNMSFEFDVLETIHA